MIYKCAKSIFVLMVCIAFLFAACTVSDIKRDSRNSYAETDLDVIGSAAKSNSLTQENTQLQDEIQNLQSELKEKAEKIMKLQLEIEDRQKEIKSLSEEIKQLKGSGLLPLSMLYIEPEYKQRFVEKELEVHLLPSSESQTLRRIRPNTVVSVNDLVEVNQERWLYVTVPVYDSPVNVKGWIRESDTVPYTKDKVSKVQSDIIISEGSPFYEVSEFKDIMEENLEIMSSDTRGRIEEKNDGYSRICAPGGWYFWVKDEYIIYPEASDMTGEIMPAEALGKGSISPSVPDNMIEKLRGSIASMKEMGPGVGPWKIIYCNGDKIILYNYAHIIACDISEKNKGIYSIIELKDLKVGTYQGSEIAVIYPSPDAMACVIGTGCWQQDYTSTMSLYFCDLYNCSVKELQTNYNMADNEVTWYRDMASSVLLPWYVSIKGNNTAIIWDAANMKKLNSVPTGVRMEAAERTYLENVGFQTGYTYYFWWKKDEDTVIGAPYVKGITSMTNLKLSDFEIVEVNLKDRSEKLLYKIPN